MHPNTGRVSEPLPPEAVLPSLDVRLKEGWRYEPRRRAFVSASGERFAVPPHLPEKTRIVPKVPALAAAEADRLSADEKLLARYVHIIFPRGADATKYLQEVRKWGPVEEARQPPAIGLPSAPG